jgi:predicted MPP superfamily phosphohydrolase
MSRAERLETKVFLFIIVTGLMNYYVLSKLFRLFGIGRGVGFYTLVALVTISYLLGAELLRIFSNGVVKSFNVIFSTWLGVSFNFLWAFAIYDLVNLIIPLPFEIIGWGILAAVLILVFYSIYNATTFSVRTIKIESEKLKKSLVIVQLSDLHIGATHKDDFLEKTIERVNEIRPDFVVLTGDLLDGVHHYEGDEFNCLRKINCPIFFVLGNHEQFLDMNKVYLLLEKTNMTFLRNRTIVHEGIQIVGIDDTKDKGLFLRNLDKIIIDNNRFTLLLYHRPNVFKEVAKRDIDLMLAGHTHGGQMFPLNLLMAIFDGPVEGLHKDNNSILYVSNGTGWWGPPMRLGSRNEITVINLVSKYEEKEDYPLIKEISRTELIKASVEDDSVVNMGEVISLKRGNGALNNTQNNSAKIIANGNGKNRKLISKQSRPNRHKNKNPQNSAKPKGKKVGTQILQKINKK